MAKKILPISSVLLAILFCFFLFPPKEKNTQFVEDVFIPQTQSEIGAPARITIPSIGVDAPIESMGSAEDGSIGVPEGPHTVAWYNLGPKPGEMGSAVITGHYGTWKNGEGSVFDNLYKLKKGDEVIISDSQAKKIKFIVQETKIYGYKDSVPELLNKTDGMYLNLVTCNGQWLPDLKTFTRRLIVFTKLSD